MRKLAFRARNPLYINEHVWRRSAEKRGHIKQKHDEIDAWKTGPLAHPLARSLAPLTRLRAPHCSLRSRAPLGSLAHSLAPELVGQWNIFVQFSRCPESLCNERKALRAPMRFWDTILLWRINNLNFSTNSFTS